VARVAIRAVLVFVLLLLLSGYWGKSSTHYRGVVVIKAVGPAMPRDMERAAEIMSMGTNRLSPERGERRSCVGFLRPRHPSIEGQPCRPAAVRPFTGG